MKFAKKAAAGAAAVGVSAVLIAFFRKLFKAQPVDVQLKVDSARMESFRKRLDEMTRKFRSDLSGKRLSDEERLLASVLMDSTARFSSLPELIEADASVMKNGYSRSRFQSVIDFLTGAGIAFLLTLSVFIYLIHMKWSIEASASDEIIGFMNTGIILSGAALVHSLLRLICSIVADYRKGKNTITLGLKLGIPEEEEKDFLEKQQRFIEETYASACAQLEQKNKNAKAGDSSVTNLVDIYPVLFEAAVLDDTYNIGGYVLPECRRLLEDKGITAVSEYTPETAHLFSAISAQDSGRSFVLKPAMVYTDSGDVISAGEYVSGKAD